MEQILNKGVRRTKSVKLALERLLPFIPDIRDSVVKVPRYKGNGYWMDWSNLTDKWFPYRTNNVFKEMANVVIRNHPYPEQVKDAVRWSGDVSKLERVARLFYSEVSALRWLTMDPQWDDWGIEKADIDPSFQDPAKQARTQEKYRSRYDARVQKTLEELG